MFGKKTCVKCGQPAKYVIRNHTIFASFGKYDPQEPMQEQAYRSVQMWKPTFESGFLCEECYEHLEAEAEKQPFKQAEEQGRRQIIIRNLSSTIQTFTDIASKFGYSLKQVETKHEPSIIGDTYDLSTMVFEKVITTANETKFVSCDYCKTRYDANQYFKCPQCGSPLT